MAGVDSAGSSLIQAVKIGNLEQVNRLIKFGASVNAVDENGQTALMIVAGPLLVFYRSFIPEMAISLMNGGADVNMKDKGGKTALMYAIANSNENTALAIMENGKDLDLNAVDNQGQTALMKAAIKGMTRIVIALIKRGVDVNMKDKEGKTALMHAIAQTDEGTALAIIEHCKDLDLNAVDNQGQAALMKAALHSKTKVADALIKRDADINMKDKEGKTALTCTIDYKRDYIAAALISEINNDFSVNSVDNQGTTVLMKAITDGMTRFAIALIKRGAYVNVKDKKGKTALLHAIAHRYEETALAIIEHSKDLDLNAVDNQGQTALMKTALRRTIKIALALIKRGADVNIKDKEGKTALMHAVFQRNENIALAIIKHSENLDSNAVDNRGQTALMKFAFEGMTTIVDALITRGSDVNIKDKEGKTALMHAIAQRYEDTAIAIIEHSKDLDLNAVDNQGQTALMRAVIHRKTIVAQALIRCGADVNKMNKKGRVALMYIGLADSNKVYSSDTGILTHELINAGADVNKTDGEGNTALMYNVMSEPSVKALIDKGKATVDSKNDLGRTALFYALVGSNLSARYLLENGANLHLTDNYNVSVLSYFIHHCINNRGADEKLMQEKFAFLNDNGVKKETIVNALINAVFCKLPLLMSPVNTISKTSITTLLTYAIKLSRKSVSFRKDNKCRLLLQYLVDSIDTDEYSVSVSDLSIRLDKLLELGADPNTCDEQGNTIAHHITLLGMYDSTVKAKSVFDVLLYLEKKGLKTNKKNGEKEIPLFLMLTKAVNHYERRLNKEFILDMCIFSLEIDWRRAILTETSQTGDSVFHLLIKLSSVGDSNEESLERCIMEILRLFSQQQRELSRIVNSTNDEMNTPLHVWAAGSQPKSREGKQSLDASEILNWQGPSEKILNLLLSCGAVHHATNLKKETPLHMCRTWTAVKLLFKAGTKTNDVDALGRSPLLSAAKNCVFLEKSGCFYPDVSPDEAPTFWQTVLGMGFDLWTCDRNGDSIISILIKENSFELADGLIKITCEKCQSLFDETLVGVLNAICKDESTQTTWKSILVDKVLRSARRPLDVSSALRSCCMNIIAHLATLKRAETTEVDSVHYEIVKQLLLYGASGESCLDVAESCPSLKALLSTPISMEERPLVIPWMSVSQKHKNQLAQVARGLNCNFQEPYWYHNKEIGHGAFGQVFVGIHEKDSMEVAVKRVRYTHRDEDIREIRSLASLPKCEHIVRYLTFLQTADYSFIIMELMEGDLGGYFASNVYDQRQTKVFCRDVVQGLKYLHEHNIIHRDLKPTNILYKTDPQLCLKIADFGLRRRVDVNSSFTVMTTGVGTRCWIAPEVMKSTTHEHSTSSDVFSCGLVFHYILSKDNRHPFSPADCTSKSELEIIPKTEINLLDNNMEGWDSGLDPEASHVIAGMLNCTNEKERPTASMLLHHPMFWSKKKKLDFLIAVGNQEEFECPRAKRTAPLTMVEQDLEKEFATIVKLDKWNNPRYTQTWPIFIEMQKPIVKHDKKGKPYNVPARKYDIGSAVELVRFIRNAISHVSEVDTPSAFSRQILKDAVFLDEFPNLVIEVFKAVTAHGWDVSRREIKYVLSSDICNRERLLPVEYLDESLVIRCWKSNSKRYNDILHRVARRQNCKLQGSYRYYSEPIAEGAFGHVFVGVHKKDGREVAIKRVSNLKLNCNRDFPRSREVITLSSLSSLPVCEQIVRYIDYITNDDFSFIIMELMEGNLNECFASGCFDPREIKKLCRDVALGLKYLHEHEIVHRDLKPGNILFRTHPKLCLKIADFGLSRRLDLSASFTVMNEGCYGTRGWIAPEVIESAEYSPSSDVFSLGLILHYILSNQSHPFDTVGCTGKITMKMINKIENNILDDKKVGWNNTLDPEASDLLLEMICADKKQRPTASSLLDHPMFWTKTKKLDFLCGVGNQEEFECPRTKKTVPLTMVEQDLENVFGTIVEFGSWNDTRYPKTSVILSEMKKTRTRSDGTKKAGRKIYDCSSAVELVRLIRNAKSHVSEPSIPAAIKKQILEAVFLDEFPNLVIEVFKAVTKHTWDVREEIKYDLAREHSL